MLLSGTLQSPTHLFKNYSQAYELVGKYWKVKGLLCILLERNRVYSIQYTYIDVSTKSQLIEVAEVKEVEKERIAILECWQVFFLRKDVVNEPEYIQCYDEFSLTNKVNASILLGKV